MFNCRSRTESAFQGVLSNPHLFYATATVIGLQIAAICIEPVRRVLRLIPPDRTDLMLIAICFVLPIVVVEMQKAIRNRLSK